MTETLPPIEPDCRRDALQRVFDEHWQRVQTFMVLRGADPDLADELARETLTRFWDTAAGSADEKSSARTSVYKIARNLSIERILHQRCWQTEEPAIAVAHAGAIAAKVIEDEHLQTHILSILESLTPGQMELLRLTFVEGRPPREIASRLGLPLAIVKSSLRQCYRNLRNDPIAHKRRST